MQASRDEPGEVGHVDEQQRPDLVSDLAEAGEVQHPGIGATARDDHLRLVFARERST